VSGRLPSVGSSPRRRL